MIAKRAASAVYCLCCLLLMTGCSDKPSPSIRLITINAGQKTNLFSYKFPDVIFKTDSGNHITIPVQDGDFISSDDLIVIARNSLPDTLTIRTDDFGTYLNEQLYQIRMDTTKKLISWIARLTDDEIKQVTCLWFDTPIRESHKASLQRISQGNPGVDLVLNYDSAELLDDDLTWLANHFRPRALMVTEGFGSLTRITKTNFPALEFLILGLEAPEFPEPLPSIPSLNNLFVFIDNSQGKLSPNFFDLNPQLEKLTIVGGDPFMQATPPWSRLSHLKELNVNMDSLLPYGLARHHPVLQTVIIQKEFNLDSIKGLKNLTWLYMGTQHEQWNLDQLPAAFPALTLLDFQNSDSLQGFSLLSLLPQLKYLVVSGKAGMDTTLYGLTGLTYLSIPEKLLQDSVRFAALKQALPSTIISPNSGVCMGTGWLLLLLPLAGAFLLVQRYVWKNVLPHDA